MKKLKKKPFVIGLPPIKCYIVTLTAIYETTTYATSREKAIEHVTEHGVRNGPVWSRITAQRKETGEK
jgi:hypothetical protein